MLIPIISRFEPGLAPDQIQRALSLAEAVVNDNPEVISDDRYNRLIAAEIGDEPAIHLDDFSEITGIGDDLGAIFLQQRARLRAYTGDWVIQSAVVPPRWSEYCEHHLGLGAVNWLYPEDRKKSILQIASACWQDRECQRELVRAIRQDGVRYVHPHMSTIHAWELAAQLASTSRQPIAVIGPHPALSRWCNDKIEFTRVASRLLGRQHVPRTECAYNFANLSQQLIELAADSSQMAIKFPFGAGGIGTFLVDSAVIRQMSLTDVDAYVRQRLSRFGWPKHGRILVDVWQRSVLNSPSVQIWIPPSGAGDPIVEGLYEQWFADDQFSFVGDRPLTAPPALQQQLVDQSYLLAILFQRLGYVGRCSFDQILVGDDIENCRVEFVECNGRWGGTSGPMTLVNRIAPDAQYATRRMDIKGLDQIEFAELLRRLAKYLYDPKTGQGTYVFFSPARMKCESAIDAIAFADSLSRATNLLETHLPKLLAEIASPQRRCTSNDNPICDRV